MKEDVTCSVVQDLLPNYIEQIIGAVLSAVMRGAFV
ncbi:hypothetical protein J2Z76_001107 [Sedimentibacter acidaminivorans]|uniref:Uncharacterized protein n=1 Tax=Sedimentibacter acidaminivorans TaxID=913099 RepID=A0ABS4GC35_9FIRM|nr:hypothetical protein [Sedimentibacter acidaminivorans]